MEFYHNNWLIMKKEIANQGWNWFYVAIAYIGAFNFDYVFSSNPIWQMLLCVIIAIVKETCDEVWGWTDWGKKIGLDPAGFDKWDIGRALLGSFIYVWQMRIINNLIEVWSR